MGGHAETLRELAVEWENAKNAEQEIAVIYRLRSLTFSMQDDIRHETPDRKDKP